MQQQHQHTRHVSFDRRVTRDINICVTLYVSHVFHVGTRSVYFNLMICPCARTIRLFHTWIWTRSCFIVFIFIYLFIFLWQMIPVFLRGFLNHTIRLSSCYGFFFFPIVTRRGVRFGRVHAVTCRNAFTYYSREGKTWSRVKCVRWGGGGFPIREKIIILELRALRIVPYMPWWEKE